MLDDLALPEALSVQTAVVQECRVELDTNCRVLEAELEVVRNKHAPTIQVVLM